MLLVDPLHPALPIPATPNARRVLLFSACWRLITPDRPALPLPPPQPPPQPQPSPRAAVAETLTPAAAPVPLAVTTPVTRGTAAVAPLFGPLLLPLPPPRLTSSRHLVPLLQSPPLPPSLLTATSLLPPPCHCSCLHPRWPFCRRTRYPVDVRLRLGRRPGGVTCGGGCGGCSEPRAGHT